MLQIECKTFILNVNPSNDNDSGHFLGELTPQEMFVSVH